MNCSCYKTVTLFLEKWGYDLISLVSRSYVAHLFWKSGMTKLSNMDNAITLFEYEYNLPLINPVFAAYMATAAELVLPVLLILGVFTRFASLGLIAMVAVIEIFVYPGTTEHYYWLMILALILAKGAGRISLDQWLVKKFL